MRNDRLLNENGTAAVESVFAIFVLLLITLGAVQVALTVYARNVVASAAHEGVRAAVELARSPAEAEAVALRTVRSAAGGLIDDAVVTVGSSVTGGRAVFAVHVAGSISPLGPVPVSIGVEFRATASRPADVP